MATAIIRPGSTAVFDTGEGGDSLSLTNTSDDQDARYTIQFDDEPPAQETLAPGQTRTYDLPSQRIVIRVANTGQVDIEADLS